MEGALIALLFALLIAMAIWVYRDDARRAHDWVELSASPPHRPDPTVRAFTKLRSHGIRCRLQHRRGAMLTLGGPGYTQTLLVHKDDVERARPLVHASGPAADDTRRR